VNVITFAYISLLSGAGYSFGHATDRSLTNLFPRQFSASSSRGDNISFAVESHNLHTYRASSSRLNFMLVTEEVDTGLSSPIIQVSFDEHSKHGGLSSID